MEEFENVPKNEIMDALIIKLNKFKKTPKGELIKQIKTIDGEKQILFYDTFTLLCKLLEEYECTRNDIKEYLEFLVNDNRCINLCEFHKQLIRNTLKELE